MLFENKIIYKDKGDDNIIKKIITKLFIFVGMIMATFLFYTGSVKAEEVNKAEEISEISVQNESQLFQEFQESQFNEGIMLCSYSGTDSARFDMLNGAGNVCAYTTITFDYSYADGSWAWIDKVNVKTYRYSGYEISSVYDTKFYSDSEGGYYTYHINVTELSTGRMYKCRFTVSCSIYGDIDGWMSVTEI